MRTNWNGRAALGLALLISASQAVSAPAHRQKGVKPRAAGEASETGPSLSETMNWIKGQLEEKGGYTQRLDKTGIFHVPYGGQALDGVRSREFYLDSIEYKSISVSGCLISISLVRSFADNQNFYLDGKPYRYDDNGILAESRDSPLVPRQDSLVNTIINLRDFDPDLVASPVNSFELSSKNSKYWENMKIEENNIYPSLHYEVPLTKRDGKYGGSFYFHEPEIADRFAKAVSHAIKLCGGKAEPF
jgi:hypothetical protein